MITHATWQDILHVAMNMREDDRAEVMATSWTDDVFDFAVECVRSPGVKLCVKDKDGIPVCVGGVANHQPGVGQAWLVGTEDIGKMGLYVATAAKGLFRSVMDHGGVHRIQAFSSATHHRAHEWLKLMGFSEESRMPNYGKAGEEFITFSMLKGASHV
jgi:hypothetical protein